MAVTCWMAEKLLGCISGTCWKSPSRVPGKAFPGRFQGEWSGRESSVLLTAGYCGSCMLGKLCALQDPAEPAHGTKKQNSFLMQSLSCALYWQSLILCQLGKEKYLKSWDSFLQSRQKGYTFRWEPINWYPVKLLFYMKGNVRFWALLLSRNSIS